MLREELVIRREELVESVRREEVRRKDDSALRREETGTGAEETGTEDSRVGRCNFNPSQSLQAKTMSGQISSVGRSMTRIIMSQLC